MGLPFNEIVRYVMGGFNPLSWFAAGEPGAWYDPSDLTTLFQDSAGTTPVTLSPMEQPVGLMRDKSGRANHAFQATAGNRPLLSARVNLLLATATLSTQLVTTVATNYTLTFTGAGTVTLSGTATGVLSAGSNTFTATAGALTLTVSGSVTLADLRPTNSGALLPPYQRVNTATDYDTVGFPLYLNCASVSTSMATSTVDFTVTDKMTIISGVRKMVTSTFAPIVECGATDTTAGAFTLNVTWSAATTYATNIKGTTSTTKGIVETSTIYGAPTSNVVSMLANIGATAPDELSLRINGASGGTQTGSAGTGTFGNFTLNLFNRPTTSLYFRSYFYGAIIRGAQSDTNSVVQTEQYMAKQTGITF